MSPLEDGGSVPNEFVVKFVQVIILRPVSNKVSPTSFNLSPVAPLVTLYVSPKRYVIPSLGES